MNWYKISKNENIKLFNEVTGAHSGQIDARILAKDIEKGIYVGGVDYVLFGDELTVSWVEVLPDYKRQGIATMMYDYMLQENPEYTYKPSMSLPEGSEFIKSRV
jgi:GNAT superfamily N-acetyltransferase